MSLRSRHFAARKLSSSLLGTTAGAATCSSSLGALAPLPSSSPLPGPPSTHVSFRFQSDSNAGWGAGTPTEGESDAEANAEYEEVAGEGDEVGTTDNSGWGAGTSTETTDAAEGAEVEAEEEGAERAEEEEDGIQQEDDNSASFSAVPELDLSALPDAPPAIIVPKALTEDEKRAKSIKEIYQPETKTNEDIINENTIGVIKRTAPNTVNIVRNRFYHTIGVDNLMPMQEALSITMNLGDINKMYNDPAKVNTRHRIEGIFRSNPDVWTVAGDYIMMHPSHSLAKSAFSVSKANAAGGLGRSAAIESITRFSPFDIKKFLAAVPDRGAKYKNHPFFFERRFNFDFHSQCIDILYFDLHKEMIVPRDRHRKNIVRKAVERAIFKAGVAVLRKTSANSGGRGIGARNLKLVVYRHLMAIEKENSWTTTTDSWEEEDEDDSLVKNAAGDDLSDEAKRVSRLEEAAKLDPYLEKHGYADLDAALKEAQDLHFMYRGDLVKMDWQQQVVWACTFIPPHGCSEAHFRKLLMTSHALPNHSRFEERCPGSTFKEWLERYWTRYLDIEETGPNAGKPGQNAPLWVKSKLHAGSFPIPSSVDEPLTGYGGFEEDCRLTCMALDVDEGRVFPDGVDKATQEGGTSLRVGDGYGLEDIISLLPRSTALEYYANSWYQLVKKTPTLSERVRLSDTAPNTRASVYVDASSGFSRELFEEACDSNNLKTLLANKSGAKYSPLHVWRTAEDSAFGPQDEVCESLIDPSMVVPEKICQLLEGSKSQANVDHELIYIFCRVAHVDKYISQLTDLVPKVLGADHTAGGRVVEINVVSAQEKEVVPVGKHHPLPPKGSVKGSMPPAEEGSEGKAAEADA